MPSSPGKYPAWRCMKAAGSMARAVIRILPSVVADGSTISNAKQIFFFRRSALRHFFRMTRRQPALFYDVGARLADGGVLIAGSAAAADRADDFSVFDERVAARRSDEGRVQRRDVRVPGFERIIENAGFAPEASRCPRL